MPEWLHEIELRAKALFNKRRLQRDLADELAFHQAMLREKFEREDRDLENVPASVHQSFGDAHRWHERLTELWQFRWLENLLRDLSFAARILHKSPGFTSVALLTLILGIGTNAAVFSLVNGLLLRPLPVPHAEELLILRQLPSGFGYSFCIPVFRLLEKRTDVFQDVFAFTNHEFQVRNGNRNESHGGALVSGQFFAGLGVPPQLGRYLNATDDQPGGATSGLAAVISDQFWKTWFNHAPDVVGSKLILDNVAFTVVGVMPRSFIGAEITSRPQIYAALAIEPLVDAPFNNTASGYHSWWFRVAARRKPGMSVAQTNAALRAISGPLVQEAIPDSQFRIDYKTQEQLYLSAESGSTGYSFLRKDFRYPLLVVFVLCGAVLLLACLNLASLLLARAAAREREIATRLAIGATRRRVIQQLLVESVLLSFTGTLAGFAVAPLTARFLSFFITNNYSDLDTSVDIRVLLFAAGIGVLCTLVIGLVPALHASFGSVQTQMRQGAQNLRRARSQRLLGNLMLTAEVALTLIVVIGAGLLGTSLMRVYRTGLGFDGHGLLLVDLDITKQSWKAPAVLQFYCEFADEAARIPGVGNVTYAMPTPFSGSTSWDDWYSNSKKQTLYASSIAPDYFQTMRIPLLTGRDFAWADTYVTPLKVVLNQAAAQYFFPIADPVGQQIRDSDGKNAKTYEVIGVVGNTKYADLREAVRPMVYKPLTQDDLKTPVYTFVLRISGKPGPAIDAIRNLTVRLAPGAPEPNFLTMDRQINEAISSMRMIVMLAVFFAICALLVTAIGLYGTLAYSTSRRTSEIGIRMALGAQRKQVVWLVFRENAIVAVIGSLAGMGVALLASRALTTLLYNTSSHDLPVMLLSVAALGAIACIASLLPALHAAHIEPIEAIRYE